MLLCELRRMGKEIGNVGCGKEKGNVGRACAYACACSCGRAGRGALSMLCVFGAILVSTFCGGWC